MNKKIISIFTLFAFIIFSISCYATKTKDVRTVADWQGKKGKILSVIKTTGEYIEFSKEHLGHISGDKIIGVIIKVEKKEVVIDQADILRTRETQKHLIITTKGGTIHKVDISGAKMKEDKMVFIRTLKSSEPASIPLSEVKSLGIKRIDPASTLLALAAVGAVGLGIGLLVVISSLED